MLKYKANNITDIAESIYYNTVYVYTDIKNMSVDKYINEVYNMRVKIGIIDLILKATSVLDLELTDDLPYYKDILDFDGNKIGCLSIIDNNAKFYNNKK